MARELKVTVTGDASKLEGALNKIQSGTQAFGNKIAGVGTALTKGLTMPIVGAGIAGLKMASDVDKGLREVNTLFGQTGTAAEKTFDELQGGVKKLSNEVGVAQDVLTKGLYSAISAGVPKENAFTFMEVAAKAAIAGVTDTETAVDGLTTTLNAFGLDASQAGAVADSMFTAVKGGKTTFEELSASLFQVAPAAAAAGVKFTDVNAALAALTAAGTPTSVATTQVRQAIVELTKDGTKAGDAFEKVAGKSFPQFIAEGGNLQEALMLVKKEADANGASMLDMFGSVEAGSAALSLTGKAAEKFTSELENQANAAGATNTAFEEMEKSGARKAEKAMVAIKNAAIDVGNILLPMAAAVADKVSEWVTKFNELSPATQKTIVAIGGVVAAIGPALFVIGKLIASFGTLVKAFKAVMLVMRLVQLLFIANPFGLLIAAVVALAALIITNWDTIKNAITTAWDWVKTKTEGWGEAMKAIATTVARALLAVFTLGLSELVRFVASNWDSIKGKTSEVWNAITGFLKGTWETLKLGATVAWNFITSSITTAVNNARTTLTNVWNGIRGFLVGIWDGIKSAASAAWNFITTSIGNALNQARSTVQGAWNGIRATVDGALGAIRGAVSGAWSFVRDSISNAINAARNSVSSAINAIKGYFDGLLTKVRQVVDFINRNMQKLAFWRHSPSLMEQMAKATVQGVNKSWDQLMAPAMSVGTPEVRVGAYRPASPSPGAGGTSRLAGTDVRIENLNVTVQNPADIAPGIARELGWSLQGISRARGGG